MKKLTEKELKQFEKLFCRLKEEPGFYTTTILDVDDVISNYGKR